ncbi:hypothetical protein DM806_10960 [Sphingobium lactosutens]|nr:hypothetical protein [Sphingobium lactosutens]
MPRARNVSNFRLTETPAGLAPVATLGLVPAIEVRGDSLTQSLAILQCSRKPIYPASIASSAMQHAAVRAMALTIICDIYPLNILRISQIPRHDMGASALVQDWIARWIRDGLPQSSSSSVTTVAASASERRR